MLGQASAADTGRLAGPGTALWERARSRRVPARRGALRSDEALCAAGLAIIVLAGLAFVLSAAAGSVFLVPSGAEQFPGWLAGPLPDLGGSLPRLVEIGLVVAMGVGWAMVLRSRASLGRSTVAAIGLVHILLLAGPPVFSTDVFGYLAFGRLGELYGLSPYSHAVGAIPVDPVNIYLSSVWPTDLSSPYGPLFLLLTYGLVPYGLTAGLWGMKVVATVAALGSVGLVARTAERLELDPVRAAAFVGLNPLWLTWVVGGAHNDLPMVLLATAGIGLMVAGRERVSGAALAAAVAVKATAGVVGLFLLAGARRPARFAAGAALAGVALLAVFLLVFGVEVLRYPATLLEQGSHVSSHNVPRELAELAGLSEVTTAVKLVASGLFLAALGILLVAVRRGADALTGAGWATVAFLLTTTSLHTWYVALLLPLAALSPSRGLRAATVAMTVVLALVQLTP